MNADVDFERVISRIKTLFLILGAIASIIAIVTVIGEILKNNYDLLTAVLFMSFHWVVIGIFSFVYSVFFTRVWLFLVPISRRFNFNVLESIVIIPLIIIMAASICALNNYVMGKYIGEFRVHIYAYSMALSSVVLQNFIEMRDEFDDLASPVMGFLYIIIYTCIYFYF